MATPRTPRAHPPSRPTPSPDMQTLRERIEARFIPEPNSGCFLWTHRLNTHGYAYISVGPKERRVQRVYYEMEKGPIPPGLVLDHLCRNRCCVNPDHLEPVTFRENIRRGNVGKSSPKTHCPKGHEYTPENIYFCKSSHVQEKRYQYCKICLQQQLRQQRLRRLDRQRRKQRGTEESRL